jgi:hypothetical protein
MEPRSECRAFRNGEHSSAPNADTVAGIVMDSTDTATSPRFSALLAFAGVHDLTVAETETLSAALSYAQVWLATGRPIGRETITTIEDVATFSMERLAKGLFDVGSVAKLTELESVDAPSELRAAPVVDIQPFRTAEDRVPPGGVVYNILMAQVAGGIRNAFYGKRKEIRDMARMEATRQLDGFFANWEADHAKKAAASSAPGIEGAERSASPGPPMTLFKKLSATFRK